MWKKIRDRLKKLTVIDFSIILIIIVALGYSLIYFTTKSEYIYLDLTSQAPDYNSKGMIPIGYQEADSIRKGDAVYNSFGQQIAEVVESKSVNFGGVDKYIWVVIKIKAKYNPRTRMYSYNDSSLLIGNSLSLSLGKVAFRGRILNIYKNLEDKYKDYQLKNVLATILFRGIESSHAEEMKSFEAKDSLNQIIAKSLDSTIRPMEFDVTTDNGTVNHGESTIYKDVILKVLLPNVPCSENTCFFNNTTDLKVGIKYFWIHSDKTFLSNGIVTNLEYVDSTTAAKLLTK